MTTDHKEALEHLKLVRETIDKSSSSRYYRLFAYAMGPVLLLSGLIMLGCLWLHHYLISVGGSKGAIITMWIIAVIIMSLMKMLVMRSVGKQEDLSLWQFIKKMTPAEFWKVDVPIELSALFAIIFCFKEDYTQFIIPIVVMMFGHFMTSMGVIFRINIFTWFGYLWVAMALLGLFFLLDSPFINSAISLGGVPTVLGFIMMIKYGGKDGNRR